MVLWLADHPRLGQRLLWLMDALPSFFSHVIGVFGGVRRLVAFPWSRSWILMQWWDQAVLTPRSSESGSISRLELWTPSCFVVRSKSLAGHISPFQHHGLTRRVREVVATRFLHDVNKFLTSCLFASASCVRRAKEMWPWTSVLSPRGQCTDRIRAGWGGGGLLFFS